MERIYLGGNRIERISPDAFNGTEKSSWNYLEVNIDQAGLALEDTDLDFLKYFKNYLVSLDIDFLSSIMPGPFPEDILQGFSKLKELRVRGGNFNSIPSKTFDGVTEMDKLDLSGNRFEQVPEAINSLNKLTMLDLCENRLSGLQENAFEDFLELRELELCKNKINSGNKIDVHSFKGVEQLQKLDLHGNELDSIPSHSFSLIRNLKHLILYDNKIITIAAHAVDSLTKLKTLDLHKNDITSVEKGAWTSSTSQSLALTSLDLSQNVLTFTADMFDGLSNLQTLNLSRTGLNAIPLKELEPLHSLKSLNLSMNDIRNITKSSFKGLKHLMEVDLNFNPVNYIPIGTIVPLKKPVRLH